MSALRIWHGLVRRVAGWPIALGVLALLGLGLRLARQTRQRETPATPLETPDPQQAQALLAQQRAALAAVQREADTATALQAQAAAVVAALQADAPADVASTIRDWNHD